MFMQQPEADRLVQAATAALARGHAAQASKLLDEAIRSDPRHPMALTKQAELAVQHKDHERARALADAALAIEPNFAPAWHQRASACWLAGRQNEAVQAAREAVNIQPPNPEFRLRLAQFAAWTGRGNETRAVLAPLLAAEPHDKLHYAAAVSMLGELAIARGDFEAATPYLDQALSLEPDLHVTRMLRGMNRLRLGQFRSGWTDYAARENIPQLYPDGRPTLAEQAWEGEDLAGKTMVVFDDQGHGDAIQFFRYLPLLRDRGAKHITWRTFPALVRLLAAAAPFATVVSTLPDNARFDFQCDSTSLPRWFDTEADTIPANVPYLFAPASPRRSARQPSRSSARHLQAGLVWSGDARHARDHLRSIPAEVFLNLADLPGIRFHSLQHEVRPEDLPALIARPAIGRHVEKAADLADTAALIANLDLVIAVDTAVAHLAAAMGKPVWVLLHVSADWRWLTDHAYTPWYPTVRLFRVTPTEWLAPAPTTATPRDTAGWRPMVTRVATALRSLERDRRA
jgi:tetratricopeptide (TPR) repeat protein